MSLGNVDGELVLLAVDRCGFALSLTVDIQDAWLKVAHTADADILSLDESAKKDG